MTQRFFRHKTSANVSACMCGRKMQSVSMQDLEQLSYWQGKRFKSGHWYNLYNPVISVELTELADRVVRNNDAVQEIQLDLTVHQHRVPENNENLLMSLSDGLLRAVQHWVTSRRLSMKTRCYLTLHAVEPIALPFTRCLGVLTNIPVFAFFPWTVSLSRTMLAMFDALSFKWLLAKLLSPINEMKLVITVIHEEHA